MVLDLERTAVARDGRGKTPARLVRFDLKPNQTRTRRRGDGLRARGTASEEFGPLTQPLLGVERLAFGTGRRVDARALLPMRLPKPRPRG